MELTYVFLLSFLLFAAPTGAVECENGWVAHKDELCIKIFTTLLTYDEGAAFCLSQGNDNSNASLVMVKEEEVQELLASYTQNVFDNVWLGGKYEQGAEDFKWEDGEPLTYTNWQDGYPRNITDSDACIELRPVNARLSTNADGKWADVNCQKRNLVMCQRDLVWTLQDAVAEIKRMRKDFEDVATRVVPVGSIYVEYSNQPDPQTLWPNLTWEDVTSEYAGLFFRASGGSAASWGSTQTECAPRVTQIRFQEREVTEYPCSVTVPQSGWSELVRAGVFSTPFQWSEGLQLESTNCEIRPQNQAVRLWKRTA